MSYYLKVPLKFLVDKPDKDDVNRFADRCAMLLRSLAERDHIEGWATASSDVSENAAIVDDAGAVVMTAKEALEKAGTS